MTNRKIATSILSFATLLLLAAPARPAELINMDVPVDDIVYDPCTDELVELSGTAHVSGSLTVNGNTYHLNAHVNYHITGIGLTSGASYSSNSIGKEAENVELNNMNVGEATVILRTSINGQGSLENVDAQVLLHVTVTPDGTMTAFVEKINAVGTCHG